MVQTIDRARVTDEWCGVRDTDHRVLRRAQAGEAVATRIAKRRRREDSAECDAGGDDDALYGVG